LFYVINKLILLTSARMCIVTFKFIKLNFKVQTVETMTCFYFLRRQQANKHLKKATAPYG
jgi:hypothetical protein